MKLVTQPNGSPLCGQACVAMLLGVTLEESIQKMNRVRGTTIKHLIAALSHKYRFNQHRLTRICHADIYLLPSLAILRVRWNPKESHWVVKCGDYVYDPLGDRQPLSSFVLTTEGRITSFLELELKEAN